MSENYFYYGWCLTYLECAVLDEVYIRFPDVSMVVDTVEEAVPASIVMTEPGVLPPLPHDELHLVVQTGLVRGGEGEENNTHVHPQAAHHWRLDPLVVP